MEGATWVVDIGSQISAPTRALSISRNGASPFQATATILMADPRRLAPDR